MTPGLQEERAAGQALWHGIKDPPRRDRPDSRIKNTSNTDVKFYAGDAGVDVVPAAAQVYRCSAQDLATIGTLALTRGSGGPADLGPQQGRRAHRRVAVLRLRQDAAVHAATA